MSGQSLYDTTYQYLIRTSHRTRRDVMRQERRECSRQQTVPVAARSEAWVCGRSLAVFVGSNTTAGSMDICCVCCVLSGRGLCDGLITRPGNSYRLWLVQSVRSQSTLRGGHDTEWGRIIYHLPFTTVCFIATVWRWIYQYRNMSQCCNLYILTGVYRS